MMTEELEGLNRQIEFCLTTAYNKGLKAGKACPYNDEEKAINFLRRSGWLAKHDETILTEGIQRGLKMKAEENK